MNELLDISDEYYLFEIEKNVRVMNEVEWCTQLLLIVKSMDFNRSPMVIRSRTNNHFS